MPDIMDDVGHTRRAQGRRATRLKRSVTGAGIGGTAEGNALVTRRGHTIVLAVAAHSMHAALMHAAAFWPVLTSMVLAHDNKGDDMAGLSVSRVSVCQCRVWVVATRCAPQQQHAARIAVQMSDTGLRTGS